MATKQKQQQWRLGPALRKHRNARGLSQREAAKEAGFSVTTWSNLEAGQKKLGGGIIQPTRPRAAVVVAAANVVGLDPAEALKMAGIDPSRHVSQTPPAPTVSQRQMIDLFARLDHQQRAALLALVESMLNDNK